MAHQTIIIPNPEAEDVSVHIEITRPQNLGLFVVTRYLDPADPSSCWDSETLSPIDKGMVVTFVYGQGGTVEVHLPYRYVDKAVIQCLVGLKSYRTTAPALVARLNRTKLVQDVRTASQNFQLQHHDFDLFRLRIAAAGWIVRKDEVDVPLLLKGVTELIERINVLTEEVPDLRRKFCLPDSPVQITSTEILEAAQREFREHQAQFVRVREERQAFIRTLDKLRVEEDKKVEFNRAVNHFEHLTEAIEQCNTIDFTRYIREIDSRFRVRQGADETLALKNHMLTLEEELGLLQKVYPVLRHLQIDGSKVIVGVPGAKFVLEDARMEFIGSAAALESYKGGVQIQTTEAQGSSKRLRRVRTRARPGPKKN